MTKQIHLIQGPNLGLLGYRDHSLYGKETLENINSRLSATCIEQGFELQCYQSDIEGEIVQHIGRIFLAHIDGTQECHGVIINPGAYSHTSIAIRDALENLQQKCITIIEVHLSNIFSREPFRHHSYISSVVKGTICGLGSRGYDYALAELMHAR